MNISRENIDRLTAFLPYFEDEGTTKFEISDSDIAGPYVYADKVKEFIQTLKEEGFLLDFDWQAWREEAYRYFTDRDLIDTADAEAVCKLFTVIIQMELLIHGVLAEMMTKGVIVQLLQRLQAIRAEGANGE